MTSQALCHGKPDPTTPAVALPPRYYWLKRLVLLYLLFLAAVAALYGSASRVIERRLNFNIEQMRARGEWVDAQDFVEQEIPDAANAAAFLLRAAKPLESMSEQEKEALSDLPMELPWTAAQMATMDAFLVKYGEVLREVRVARGKRQVKWGYEMRSPAIQLLFPWLSGQRQLSRLLCQAALHAHQKGDDAAAVEYLRDLLTIADAVDRSPFVVCHLVAGGITLQAAKAVSDMAPNLRVGETPAGAPDAVHPATRQEVKKLIDQLLDDAAFREGFVRAMQGERYFLLDTIQCIANGKLGGEQILTAQVGPGTVVRPLVLNEGRAVLERSSQMIDVVRQADLLSATAKMPAASTTDRFRHPLLSMWLPSLAPAVNRHYSILFQRRAVAIVLAERLYVLDHGRPPASLAELIPDYLPSAPQDPMTGQPMTLGSIPMAASTRPSTGRAGQN